MSYCRSPCLESSLSDAEAGRNQARLQGLSKCELSLHYITVSYNLPIRLMKLKVSWLESLKYLLRIVLPAYINQTLLIRFAITSKDVLIRRSIILIHIFVIRIHGLGQSNRGVDQAIASSGYPVVV